MASLKLRNSLAVSTQELLEDSLLDPPIGHTRGFQWHATPIGIAALSNRADSIKPEKLYEDAIKEGLEIGLELTKEEREFHSSRKGLVILFQMENRMLMT